VTQIIQTVKLEIRKLGTYQSLGTFGKQAFFLFNGSFFCLLCSLSNADFDVFSFRVVNEEKNAANTPAKR